MGCAGKARARSGTLKDRPCDSESVIHGSRGSGPLPSAGFAGATNPGGRLRKGGEAPLRGSLAPSAARSTYREYASRAALGRRLAAGPFSSLSPERFSDRLLAGRGRRPFTSLARLTLPSTIWPGVIDARPLAVQEQPGQAERLRQGGEPPFRVRRPPP